MTVWNPSRMIVGFPGLEPIEPGTPKCPITAARNIRNGPNRNIAAKMTDGNPMHDEIEAGIEAGTVGETAITLVMTVSIGKIAFADHVNGAIPITRLPEHIGRIDANRRLDPLPRPEREAFAMWMGITNLFRPGPTNGPLRPAATRRNPVRPPCTAAGSRVSLIR